MAGNKRDLLASRLKPPLQTLEGPSSEEDLREGKTESETSQEDIGPPGPPLAMLSSEENEINMESRDAGQSQEIETSPPRQEQSFVPESPAIISDKPAKRRGRPPKNQKKPDNQEKRNVLHFEVSEEVARKFEELFAPGVPGRFKSQSELIRFYVYQGLEKELELMRDFQKVLDRREKKE